VKSDPLCVKCSERRRMSGFTSCAECDLAGVNAVRQQNGLAPWTAEQLEVRLKERDPKTFARR
jgi:hypothetical protein